MEQATSKRCRWCPSELYGEDRGIENGSVAYKSKNFRDELHRPQVKEKDSSEKATFQRKSSALLLGKPRRLILTPIITINNCID